MGFEQYKLDKYSVFDLYQNSLVQVEENTKGIIVPKKNDAKGETANSETLDIPIVGGNRKRISIAIAGSFTEIEWETYNSTLIKMLAALKMSMDDVAVMKTDSNNLCFTDIKKVLNPLYMIAFETNEYYIKLPTRNDHFDELLFDGVTFLIAPLMALSANRTDPAILAVKNKLWASLQRIFPIGK